MFIGNDRRVLFLNVTVAKYNNISFTEDHLSIYILIADMVMRDLYGGKFYNEIKSIGIIESVIVSEIESTRGKNYKEFCIKMEKIVSIFLKQQGIPAV